MNKRLVKQYLIFTFGIMLLGWGSCALISQTLDISVDQPFMRALHLFGGMSPTIASYIVLKRHGAVSGFKDWLKQVFDVKHRPMVYLMVVLFVGIYYLCGCLISGYTLGAPVFMILAIAPLMLLGGGNEEAGWRMILQPELEKQYSLFPAAIMVGVIWWLWHLPLFFIKGTANAEMSYLFFGIMCLTLSIALATIRRVSGGVFPCVLTHCLINGFSGIFLFDYTWADCLTTLVLTVIVSAIVLHSLKTQIQERNEII